MSILLAIGITLFVLGWLGISMENSSILPAKLDAVPYWMALGGFLSLVGWVLGWLWIWALS